MREGARARVTWQLVRSLFFCLKKKNSSVSGYWRTRDNFSKLQKVDLRCVTGYFVLRFKLSTNESALSVI